MTLSVRRPRRVRFGWEFGISPDGREMTVAGWEQVFSLMLAERVPGVDGPRRPR